MQEKGKVDLFTLGLVLDEDGRMVKNNAEELLKYLREIKFIEAVNFYFLVALPTIEETTKGGIILSEETKEHAMFGNNIARIISKGETVGGSTNNFSQCRKMKVGDYIGYNPNTPGTPREYGEERVICIPDSAIKINIPDPTRHSDGIFRTFAIKGIQK